MRLTAEDLRSLAAALDEMSKTRRTHGVDLAPYGPLQVGVADAILAVEWDNAQGFGEYVVADRNGD